MAVETLISVEEYLNTSYDPDVEYVDGVLVERNVGDWLHSWVQRNLIVAFTVKYPSIYAVPELRSKTRETRYRLPDVCVLLQWPETPYLMDAAFIAIEVLSQRDSMSSMMEKLAEYDRKGVKHIWVIDPRLQTIHVYGDGVLNEVKGESVATDEPRLELTRAEIFRR
jgi:Uma2 family endonuclease